MRLAPDATSPFICARVEPEIEAVGSATLSVSPRLPDPTSDSAFAKLSPVAFTVTAPVELSVEVVPTRASVAPVM